MLPFLLSPSHKEYIWGGSKLKTLFGKESPFPIMAESWELSVHPDGESTIASGKFSGTKLSSFAKAHPELLGTKSGGTIPLLIKLIDSKQALSIQVHPDDKYARKVENDLGKAEMWNILDHEKDAFVYFGFTKKMSKDEVRQRILENTITEVLNKIKVKKGDCFFIKPGTIHAIGNGIVLAEIQQSSNSTYRVYDYNRHDANGNPRELHIDKAIDVLNLCPTHFTPDNLPSMKDNGNTIQRITSCKYFTVDKLKIDGTYCRTIDGTSFMSLLCVDGSAKLSCCGDSLTVSKGQSLFVPSNNSGFELSGLAEFLITTI